MEGMAPILHAADARASSNWYAQLGFTVESEHAFGPDWPLYVRLRRGPAQLHLSEHRLDGGPLTHVYLYVEDVDSIIPAGTIAEDCPWGMREARLTDPDGNEVRVGSPLRLSAEVDTVFPSMASGRRVQGTGEVTVTRQGLPIQPPLGLVLPP